MSLNNLATTISGLADLLRQTKQYDTILPLYEQAVAVVESSLGSQHPNVALNLKTLATFYGEQGRLAEAVSLDEKALHMQENALSPNDPAVAETLQHLAELYEKLGNHEKADQALARARAATPR